MINSISARLRLVLAAVVISLVAACETAPPTPVYPDITFGHQPTIALSVAALAVEQSYVSPLAAPNIEHTMPGAPLDAASRWFSDRLRATGNMGTATFTLKQMSVKEVALEKTTGVIGAFTTDQSERYDAVVEATITVVDPSRNAKGSAFARAERSTTVPEDATLNEREQVLFTLAEKLMADFDSEIERSIRENLSDWIAP